MHGDHFIEKHVFRIVPGDLAARSGPRLTVESIS